MKKFLPFILLVLTIGMTSCSLDDDLMMDERQIDTLSTQNVTPPPGEETGEEDDLEPNG